MGCKKILIIEDEESISELLSYSLKKDGFTIEVANDGEQGIQLIEKFKPQMIILDLMLPDMSGFEICKMVMKKHTTIPVVIITAKVDSVDKILGMELGADDYITKPFYVREVIVRIKSIFRRIELTAKMVEMNSFETIQLGNGIMIVKEKREVFNNNEKLLLTNKEYQLLLFLVENNNIVFSRSELLDKVWGFEYAGDTRTVDLHIQRIRKKLNDRGANLLQTVFGVGYKITYKRLV